MIKADGRTARLQPEPSSLPASAAESSPPRRKSRCTLDLVLEEVV